MAAMYKMYEHFQTTYLERYKSRTTEINIQPLLYAVEGVTKGSCKKVKLSSVRDTNSFFGIKPSLITIANA